MAHLNTFGEPLSPIMTVFNFLLPLISFVLTAAGLGIDWQYAALSLGSSIAGSLLFGYIRRERTFGAQIYKIAMSTIAGMIGGSLIVHWRAYEAGPVVSATYCLSAMLVLVFLRTVVRWAEENAPVIVPAIAKIILRKEYIPEHVQDSRGKRRRSKGGQRRRTSKGVTIEDSSEPGGPPVVTIEPTAEPEEVRVVEETVIETKKDG